MTESNPEEYKIKSIKDVLFVVFSFGIFPFIGFGIAFVNNYILDIFGAKITVLEILPLVGEMPIEGGIGSGVIIIFITLISIFIYSKTLHLIFYGKKTFKKVYLSSLNIESLKRIFSRFTSNK